MTTKQYMSSGFGLLLMIMAVTQLLTFGHFNHAISSYIVPPGGEMTSLIAFMRLLVFPLASVLVLLELAGAAGFLMSDENIMKSTMMKAGVLAVSIWFLLILTVLLRGAPIAFVGFFGDKMRQPVNVFALIQSAVFVVWGIAAYRTQQD